MSKEVIFLIRTMESYGGTQRHVTLLANKMAEKGFKVYMLSLYNKTPFYPLNPGITNLEVNELCPKTLLFSLRRAWYMKVTSRLRNRIVRPIAGLLGCDVSLSLYTFTNYYYCYSWSLRRFLIKHPGSTVFVFLYDSAAALVAAAKGLPVKSVYCEMNSATRNDIPQENLIFRDKCVRYFHYAIFQTEDEKAYFDSLITGEKAVIPNPLRSDLPAPYAGERSKRIVNFCRIDRQKNLPLLISAFSDIHRKHPAYRLEIYGRGEGRDEEAVFSYIKQCNLENCVSVLPFCSDVHFKVLDAAMFVSTSDFEGISNSMLEAMAIGLPCICTDCDGGGAREMIKDGENGLLVPKGNKKAVAEAIEKLIENPGFAASLGQNATAVRGLLDEDKIVERWIKMI